MHQAISTFDLASLRVACDAASSMCHRYWVEDPGHRTVRVYYSNPDEYGHERPVYASFPRFLIGGTPWVQFDSFVSLHVSGWRRGGFHDDNEAFDAIYHPVLCELQRAHNLAD